MHDMSGGWSRDKQKLVLQKAVRSEIPGNSPAEAEGNTTTLYKGHTGHATSSLQRGFIIWIKMGFV